MTRRFFFALFALLSHFLINRSNSVSLTPIWLNISKMKKNIQIKISPACVLIVVLYLQFWNELWYRGHFLVEA